MVAEELPEEVLEAVEVREESKRHLKGQQLIPTTDTFVQAELVEEPEVDSEAAVSLVVEADHLSEAGEAPGVDSAVADEEDREEDLVAEVEANDDTEVYLFLPFFDLFSFSAMGWRCNVELMYSMHPKI